MKTAHADMNGKTATTPTKLSILSLENASVPSKAAQLTIHGTLTNAHVLAIKSTNAQGHRNSQEHSSNSAMSEHCLYR